MVQATSISVSPEVISLKPNEPQTVTATVYPSDASQTVTWSSSNPEVISVTPSGVVSTKSSTPLSGAVIKATTTDGTNLNAQCMVAIFNPKSNTNTTGLSNGAITGIIIGCTIFGIGVIIVFVYIIKMISKTTSDLAK